jgi:hypothetical protein
MHHSGGLIRVLSVPHPMSINTRSNRAAIPNPLECVNYLIGDSALGPTNCQAGRERDRSDKHPSGKAG